MSIIQFKEANCKSCYKCIRNCAVKAIRFKEEQARIVEEDCVFCGTCTLACPQNAKEVFSDLDDVKKLLRAGEPVYASLAPSFMPAFPGCDFSQVSAALKQMGFAGVEETAIGAALVSRQYTRILENREMKNLITTCCPSVCLLVERYFPSLIPYLAPVVSPATAHAKMIKEAYGAGTHVVFIGPCIAKKYEAWQNGVIDRVLLFDEVKDWMSAQGIRLGVPDSAPSEMHEPLTRIYPVPGGNIRTIPHDRRTAYHSLAVDGLERCIETLRNLEENDVEGYVIEMSSCAGSCVDGPGIRRHPAPFLLSKSMVNTAAKGVTKTPRPPSQDAVPDLSARYNHTRVRPGMPPEEELIEIYHAIGKYTQRSMLNCGACGYNTCRDKAVAVYHGKADLHMCLPYLREKAESMSNLILDSTPHAVFVIDSDLTVLSYNKTALTIFGLTAMESMGLPIQFVLDAPEFSDLAGAREKTLIVTTYEDRDRNLTLELTIASAENTREFIVIAKDITAKVRRRAQMEQMRQETVDIAQKVIDKQMRVAQEIASLLGETTGETKAALTRLKKSMTGGEGN